MTINPTETCTCSALPEPASDDCPIHGEPSAVDPGAIDLEAAKECQKQADFAPNMRPHVTSFVRLYGPALIAEVEVLRERVAKLQAGAREATAKRPTWQCCDPWFDGLLGGLLRRAEATEARVVELAGALESLTDALKNYALGDGHSYVPAWENARVVLAATPAKALGRARVINILVQAAQKIEAVGWQPVGSQHCAEIYFATNDECQTFGHALDIVRGAVSGRLDALGKEEPQ